MAGNITVKEDINKLLDGDMRENEKESLKKKSSQVSCYLSVAQKISLELEVVYFKNDDTEDAKKRNSINRNISYILEQFIDKYIDNIETVKDVLVNTLNTDINSQTVFNNKLIMRDISLTQNQLVPYPLILSDDLITKFKFFKKKCEEKLNFNFSKTTFYNLILLDYYLRNKATIAKWQMEHWTQNYYYRRNIQNDKLDDIVKQIDKLLLS
jgi:hypothetical protein